MEIQDKQIGSITILTITGSIDAITASTITEHINGLIQQDHIKLVADLASVDYTSSAGLRVLLGAIKSTRSKGGDLFLANIQPDVEKVLALSGFTSILKVFDNVEDAIAGFG